jgi:hypothetical protein
MECNAEHCQFFNHKQIYYLPIRALPILQSQTNILPANQSTANAIDFSVVEHLAIHSNDQGSNPTAKSENIKNTYETSDLHKPKQSMEDSEV